MRNKRSRSRHIGRVIDAHSRKVVSEVFGQTRGGPRVVLGIGGDEHDDGVTRACPAHGGAYVFEIGLQDNAVLGRVLAAARRRTAGNDTGQGSRSYFIGIGRHSVVADLHPPVGNLPASVSMALPVADVRATGRTVQNREGIDPGHVGGNRG